MDITILIRLALMLAAVCVAAKEVDSNTDEASPSLEVILKGKRSQRKHANINDESTEVEENKTTKPCCYNGGICIMNAFCHCKKKFYGRRCEHRQRHRSCGTISHGTWMAVACHLCHCFDGEITCKTSAIKGCDKMPYTEGKETEPDYNVGIDKKVEDYDIFYENFEDPAQLKSSSMLSSELSISCLVVFTLAGILVNVGS